jgi:hypothetical protein
MDAVIPLIRSAAAHPDSLTITLIWADGSTTTKAMGPLVARRKVFRPLVDPELFRRVRVINEGRGIAWDGDADMCADALWYDAHPQDNPFTAETSAAE